MFSHIEREKGGRDFEYIKNCRMRREEGEAGLSLLPFLIPCSSTSLGKEEKENFFFVIIAIIVIILGGWEEQAKQIWYLFVFRPLSPLPPLSRGCIRHGNDEKRGGRKRGRHPLLKNGKIKSAKRM